MKWRHAVLFTAGAGYAWWGFTHRPFPLLGEDPTLDLVAAYSPRFYHWIQAWYYVTPGLAVLMGGLVLLAVWRVWFALPLPRRGPPREASGLAASTHR